MARSGVQVARSAGRPSWGSSARYLCPRNSSTAIRCVTAAVRNCATSSRPVSSVLSGTSTAPILVRASAIRTHSQPLGISRPTRVPFPTPAWMKPAAKARVPASSSS